METPEIWVYLGTQIHQDFVLDYPDVLVGLVPILNSLEVVELKILHGYLLYMLEGANSDARLVEFWRDSGSEILFTGENVRQFLEDLLQEVRRVIEKKLDGN